MTTTIEPEEWEPTQDFQDGYDLGVATERLRIHQEIQKAVDNSTIEKWLKDNRPEVWTGK